MRTAASFYDEDPSAENSTTPTAAARSALDITTKFSENSRVYEDWRDSGEEDWWTSVDPVEFVARPTMNGSETIPNEAVKPYQMWVLWPDNGDNTHLTAADYEAVFSNAGYLRE